MGKIDIPIPFEVGVKQGDIVAPVLFLFIMMAFVETIEKEWVRNDLKIIKFKRHRNSPRSSGRITSNPAKTISHGTLLEILCMLYVDDGAFAYKTRKDMEIVSNSCSNTITISDCKRTSTPIQNSPKQNAYFPLPLVTSNY